MSHLRSVSLSMLAAGMLAANLLAPTARADDAACKPVVDAMTRTAGTPYHEFINAGGVTFEKIYTTTALYVGRNGRWMKTAASPKALLDATRESGATFTQCKSLRTETVDGQRATVYAVHERLTATAEDDQSQIWIANATGLPLKLESESRHAGKPTHVSTHFTYANVQPPVGAH